MTNPQQFLFFFFFKATRQSFFQKHQPLLLRNSKRWEGEALGPTHAIQTGVTTETLWVSVAHVQHTLTQLEHCALHSSARPDLTTRAALRSLHVYNTYKEGICCGEGLHKQSRISLQRKKKKKRKKSKAEDSFHP